MIGKYIVGPRRVAIAYKMNDVIVADPAIDILQSNLDHYQSSLFELEWLKYLPGEKPSLFTIQPLTRRQKDAAESMSMRERSAWYLRCSLLGTSNYQVLKQDNSLSEIASPERIQNGSYGLMAPEMYIDELDLPEQYLLGLMLMIRHISEAQIPISAASSKPSGAAE